MNSKIIFNVVGFLDRRGPRELEAARALEQARADAEIDQLWRERVSRHPVEQRRLRRGETWMPATVPSFLLRQAD